MCEVVLQSGALGGIHSLTGCTANGALGLEKQQRPPGHIETELGVQKEPIHCHGPRCFCWVSLNLYILSHLRDHPPITVEISLEDSIELCAQTWCMERASCSSVNRLVPSP